MRKLFLILCTLFLITGCSPKIDYSFFYQNGRLTYVMEHTDETRSEFEAEHKRFGISEVSPQNYELSYKLVTPYVTIETNGHYYPRAEFQFGSTINRTDNREEEHYEIDETAQKLFINGKVRGHDEPFIYTFKIIDCETLQFIAAESSSVEYGVEERLWISVPDGAIFHLEK